MAIKIGAALETDLIRLVPASTFTTAQNYLTLNKYLRQVWEANANWTRRYTPTEVDLITLEGQSARTTGGTYGARLESIHGAFLETGGVGTAVSNIQLERLEVAEIRNYMVNGVDGAGPETNSSTPFYAAEALAADSSIAAADHGLWRFLFYPTWDTVAGSGDRQVSVKARPRYVDIASTDYYDGPDSWGDLVAQLAAIEQNLLMGHSDLAQSLAALLPKDQEQFARRIFENVKPRSGGGEMVAR